MYDSVVLISVGWSAAGQWVLQQFGIFKNSDHLSLKSIKPTTFFQSQYYFDYLFLQLRGFVTDWSCKLWNFWQGLLWQCQDNVLLICDMRKVFLPERNYYYPMAFKRKIPYGQTSAKLPVIMSLCHCHQVFMSCHHYYNIGHTQLPGLLHRQ